MCRTEWFLLTLLACMGCQRAAVAPPQNQVEPAISAEKIFDTLTANSWTSLPLSQLHPDHSVSSYRADGTYSYDFFTDYSVPTKAGKWNLQSLQGQWYLCQDDGKRVTITLNEDGSITVLHGNLYPHKPLPRQPGADCQNAAATAITAGSAGNRPPTDRSYLEAD